jgi:hypothetical protein
VPSQTCRRAIDSAKRPNRRQKPPSCGHFSDNLRHVWWERGKNSGKTSGISIKNGGKWRFFEGQSAILTSAYARGIEAQTAGMRVLTSASGPATSEVLDDNSKMERHFHHAPRVGEWSVVGAEG